MRRLLISALPRWRLAPVGSIVGVEADSRKVIGLVGGWHERSHQGGRFGYGGKLGSASSPSTPHRTDNDLIRTEGVIDMACGPGEVQPPKSRDMGFRVDTSSPGEQGHHLECFFELRGENLGVVSMLQPPGFFALNMALRSSGKPDAAPVQRERSSLRTSSASTSLPAETSASDMTSASQRAVRSSSSSQSPGSNGSSSITVPSGRSVGSSTTKRPSRTCALMLMLKNLALRVTPNKADAADARSFTQILPELRPLHSGVADLRRSGTRWPAGVPPA